MFWQTGFIHDSRNGVTGDTCCGELCEARGGDCVIRYLLPDTSFSHQFSRYKRLQFTTFNFCNAFLKLNFINFRNWFGPSWSFLVFQGKADKAKDCLTCTPSKKSFDTSDESPWIDSAYAYSIEEHFHLCENAYKSRVSLYIY